MVFLILIIINIVVFAIPFVFNFGRFGRDSFTSFISLGWKSNPDIISGDYYRFLTSTFLHGSFLHLLFNMISLYNVGPVVLLIYRDSFKFLLIYIVSGIVGSLFSFLFNPNVPSLGASGSIMGLVGAVLAYAIITRDYSTLGSVMINILFIFGIGLSDPRIDNFGHLGGLVGGFILGLILLLI